MKEIYVEKEDAVSPVIATILMVAITVVLAATVYILVSHYTSVGANTPLTATLSETTEGGGFVVFSLSLSTPSNITPASDIHLTVSGANITSPTTFTYHGGLKSSPDYWISSSAIAKNATGATQYYVVITFTDPNGLAANTTANYVASGATMNVYIVTVPSSSSSFTPSITASGTVSNTVSGWTMSGITISMTVSGHSGTITATAP